MVGTTEHSRQQQKGREILLLLLRWRKLRVCLPTEFSWFTSSLSSFYLLLPCPSGATYLQYYGLLWTKKVHKIISFGKFQNHHFWILIGNFLNDFSNLPTQSENKMFMLDEMNPEKCFMLERVTIFPFFISCYFIFLYCPGDK